MDQPLRILCLENDAADAALMQDTLETNGIACGMVRVDTESSFVAALQDNRFDLILADYTLPSFDGLSALRIAHRQRPELPFIIVSGTMGEEVAIEALKIGATDYVLKTRLSRLVPSVDRALREARERTELRRAEAALRLSEAKIRKLVDANIVGVVIAAGDGRIIEANDAFLQMVRRTRDDLASGRLRWAEMTPPEWQAVSERAVAQLATTGTCELFEKEYIRSDGTRVPVLIGAAAIDGANGESAAFVLDLTERRRAEQERDRLRQIQDDLAYISRVITAGELAASLAHEIKQPITAAATNAGACLRWLQHVPPEIDRAREVASRIIKEVTRAADIIDRNSSLFRRELPKKEFVELNKLIREMVAMLYEKATQHGVAIHARLDTLAPISADRVQLQQVLMNLMLNGIEAMTGNSGELTVTSGISDEGELLIRVTDSGVGLPAGDAGERVFEPFFTTKTHGRSEEH